MDIQQQDYYFHRSVLEIDLKKIKENYHLLRRQIPKDTFFCPMVKDQAYGHGAVPVVRALLEEGVRHFGVIDVSEAWQLREFIKDPFDILIFGPVLNDSDMSWAIENQLTLVINNWKDLESLSSKKQEIKIHLKFDTGFSRLGFSFSESKKVQDFLKKYPFLKVEALCTQLVSGEDMGDVSSFSFRQVENLKSLQSLFPSAFLHAFNTAALLSLYRNGKMKEQSAIGVRSGIGLYGIVPEVPLFVSDSREGIPLKAVSTLKSYVVGVHHLKKGAVVSYSGHWKAKKDSVIVTVSLGYGDGFLRGFGQDRDVLFRGQRIPIVGTVCMDFFMADVTDCIEGQESVLIGEEVVVFGQQGQAFLSIEEQSKALSTIPYEILTRLGERVERVYIS